MRTKKLTPTQRDAVLTGLRLLQREIASNGGRFPEEWHELATNLGDHDPIGEDEIDDLCELVNWEDIRVPA